MRYADFTAWVSEHAIMLDAFDGATADIEKLSFLDKHLAGKRAAFLVEMNHFIHEKYDFRLFLGCVPGV